MEVHSIGFIGQGFIGKNMADDFEERGYVVVRYAKEGEYVGNREAIADCDIVFIAVPTPTTPSGFDSSILESVLHLIGDGKVAVIKSTILPGTTKRLRAQFPGIHILHAPEFLTEKNAYQDARTPSRNIIGVPEATDEYRAIAEAVMTTLPESPYDIICSSEEAELIKYGSNNFLALKVVYMNLLYDAAEMCGADYEVIAAGMAADNRIGKSHMHVLDQSGHDGAMAGRGAGGHCFPKDLAAFADWYQAHVTADTLGSALLAAIEKKNTQLLTFSRKDVDILTTIYGS